MLPQKAESATPMYRGMSPSRSFLAPASPILSDYRKFPITTPHRESERKYQRSDLHVKIEQSLYTFSMQMIGTKVISLYKPEKKTETY